MGLKGCAEQSVAGAARCRDGHQRCSRTAGVAVVVVVVAWFA